MFKKWNYVYKYPLYTDNSQIMSPAQSFLLNSRLQLPP